MRTNRVVRWALLAVPAAVSVWSLRRIPEAALLPAVLGMLPWVVGKYVFCPLRWHALSTSGRARRWHLRAYAESELLGLATPAHAGADLWRIHRLHGVGMSRGAAVAEVALDRLVGALGLAGGVALVGVALPRAVLLVLLAVCAVVVAGALLLRWRRPDLLRKRPLPGPRPLAAGLALSMAYQATMAGLLFGAVTAVGEAVHPLHLIAVYGASQIAGVVPGMAGASPRDGALVVGLTSVGLTWGGALAAVALTAVLVWVPALLFGGVSLAVRRIAAARAAARCGA
jgi:glycosyltransferase 2 family protein